MMVIRKIFLRSTKKFSKSEILTRVFTVAKILSKLNAKFKMNLHVDGQPNVTSILPTLLSKPVHM